MVPAARVPGHARPFLETLFSEELATLEALTATLEQGFDRPAVVSQTRRFAAVFTGAQLPMLEQHLRFFRGKTNTLNDIGDTASAAILNNQLQLYGAQPGCLPVKLPADGPPFKKRLHLLLQRL